MVYNKEENTQVRSAGHDKCPDIFEISHTSDKRHANMHTMPIKPSAFIVSEAAFVEASIRGTAAPMVEFKQFSKVWSMFEGSGASGSEVLAIAAELL